VAALRELAGGRADLLAEVAGILEGASEGELHEPLARQAAGLCRQAGADEAAIPAWIEEGRRRRAAARMPPPSGGVHGLAPGSAEGSRPVHVRVRPERFILGGLPRGGVVDDYVSSGTCRAATTGIGTGAMAPRCRTLLGVCPAS